MKNASEIINTIQQKPQYKRILTYRCVDKLKSVLLPTIQRSIKYGYIKNSILYFVISSSINKYDKDNIINTIKMILNSPMILESDKFIECNAHNIEDIIVYTDHKPRFKYKPYITSSHNMTYYERSNGDFSINIKDEKLKTILKDIKNIIKEKHDT
jgi:hypothetical protein